MKIPVRNQSIHTANPPYKSSFAAKGSQYGARTTGAGTEVVNTDENMADDENTGSGKTDSLKAGRPEVWLTDTLLISKDGDEKSKNGIRTDEDDNKKNPADAMKANGQMADGTGGGFNISCSVPDDSTGQLAAMLARAETKMDVQQVSSKAIRALSALKMSSVFAEGDDAKKVSQRIRRMEKLINRISKKQQQLNKEEVLELQRKSAEKLKEMKRAQELKKELDNKRTKRRRDERNYAAKEIAQDEKEAAQEMYANMTGASASCASVPASVSAPSSDLPAMADLGAVAADLSAAEGASLDITV